MFLDREEGHKFNFKRPGAPVAYLEIGEGGGHINEVWRSGNGRPLVGFSWWRSGAMGVFRGFPSSTPLNESVPVIIA